MFCFLASPEPVVAMSLDHLLLHLTLQATLNVNWVNKNLNLVETTPALFPVQNSLETCDLQLKAT